MTDGKGLCLLMMMNGVAPGLDACLAAVAPHLACWVVADAGASADTGDVVRSFFARRQLPGEWLGAAVGSPEEVRNAALDRARAAPLAFDYLLVAEPGLELVVEESRFRERLTAPAYRVPQRDDRGLLNWRPRLLARGADARMRGALGGEIDVSGEVTRLSAVWFRDLATAADRAAAAQRDIDLMVEALAAEPDNARYWYDLARAYRDAGRFADAAQAFLKRAEMGGRAEEAWSARLLAARCLRRLGDEGGFLREALAAFEQRPHRAEPLYDLSRFHRERGRHAASVLFSEPGLDLALPQDDAIDIQEFVYAAGLREEYSISANYARDPARKARGHQACNWLALRRGIPAGSRSLARLNLRFYATSAAAIMPSFAPRPVGLTPPGGGRPANPSVARWGDRLVATQRSVHYILDRDGFYHRDPDAAASPRNYLLQLDDDLEVQTAHPLLPPDDLPLPNYAGVEPTDLRLFAWRGALWCIGHIREMVQGERWINQILARIDAGAPDACRLTDWRMLRPAGPRAIEKNWMPLVVGDALRFLYLCDPTRVLNDEARLVGETVPTIAADDFRGGTQVIPFDGGWLALIHQVASRDGRARLYDHRFVWFDRAAILRRVSRQFHFREPGVEFAAGLAWHPDERRLLISYGINDAEAWIAAVEAADVAAVLEDVGDLPWGQTTVPGRGLGPSASSG